MKKVFSFYMAVFISLFAVANAQDKTLGQEIKKDAKTTGKAIDKGAKKVGNKSGELVNKGIAKIADKTYKGKVGPDGQTIYIDKYSKYYWIDKTGTKHYVTKLELKDKQS